MIGLITASIRDSITVLPRSWAQLRSAGEKKFATGSHSDDVDSFPFFASFRLDYQAEDEASVVSL